MTHVNGRGLTPIVLAALLAGVAGGCAKQPPVVEPPPVPPLEVPVTPPRLLAPVAMPEPQLPAEPPLEPAPPAKPRPTRPASEPRPDTQKTDPATEPPAGPPAPVETARPEAPAPALRTPQTADDTQAERRVREVLGRASGALQRVNAAALNADARAQFETARRFIDQSNDALKARNYMFAAYLADKAATLAAGLSRR